MGSFFSGTLWFTPGILKTYDLAKSSVGIVLLSTLIFGFTRIASSP